MQSILTNSSAITALGVLRSINKDLSNSQQEIATGLRVSTASDNAAYWSIATTMRADTKAISAVADSLGLGQAILDTAHTGMAQVLEYFDQAKQLIVMASNEGPAKTNGTWHDYAIDPIYDGTTLGKIDKQLRGLFDAMAATIDSSSFNGINLLKIERGGPSLSSSVEFVSGLSGAKVLTTEIKLKDTVLINYNRSGDFYDYEAGAAEQGILDGKIDIVTYELTTTYYSSGQGRVLPNGDFYILRNGLWNYNNTAGYNSNALTEYYDNFINGIDGKIKRLTAGMAAVGALQKSMAMSSDFVQSRIDTNHKGIGRLVDADMDEASTRLKALQTQQQLGMQTLQITNSNADNVMQLFR